ncbi:hypothetical protein IDJ77_04165 [Mucilaginibacter sp. ZT4R22]|uniref:Uncharacterized protein n=1 Tax=Mucilaginibacter pankratovii TaxID=2772110 RepID=A0ABR7WKZ5_9SPHI|nr:hypothetical protein [Mucilaginibacter pankratovii]MBD1362997.1 hypothetical protein [Mucilaginibacter pankratovii]
MKQINLNILKDGTVGLSPGAGGNLAEAASVCLDFNGHPRVIVMPAEGHFEDDYEFTCSEVSEIMRNSFSDMQEATEYGACGIALSIVATETSMIAKRSVKGTGFDYWLGTQTESFPFQEFARLEVSGIITGTEQQTGYRLTEKLKQTKVSDDKETYLPAYAVVVEFSNPRTLSGIR